MWLTCGMIWLTWLARLRIRYAIVLFFDFLLLHRADYDLFCLSMTPINCEVISVFSFYATERAFNAISMPIFLFYLMFCIILRGLPGDLSSSTTPCHPLKTIFAAGWNGYVTVPKKILRLNECALKPALSPLQPFRPLLRLTLAPAAAVQG